jgi:outer membrane lipoprotein SlyB
MFGILPLILAACGAGYSPNTYASDAAQEEAAVQRGVIIGVRQVMISADGTIGAATGGAVGGVAGSQGRGGRVAGAGGAFGGTLVGGIGGNVAAHAVGDAKGWEYIVQEAPDGKLVSVTQTSKVPLAVGLHVLVIAGNQQARIVPDYTVAVAAPAPPKPPSPPAAPPPEGAATMEINVDPVLPDGGGLPEAPVTVASDPAAGGKVGYPVAAPAGAGVGATGSSVSGEGLSGGASGTVAGAGAVAQGAAGETATGMPAASASR